MPPPTDWTASEESHNSTEADVPTRHEQDTTYVAQRSDARKPSVRDRIDHSIFEGCIGALRLVRHFIKFASPEKRDQWASEAYACAHECERVADSGVTLSDKLFDQLLVGLDDRWRR